MSCIKNHKLITIVIAVMLITAIALAIILPFTLGNNSNVRSEYDYIKNNKMNNYKLINENYSKKGQIVLLGDSITELYNTELFNAFTEKTGLTVYNRGISGDTSDKCLERIEINALNIRPRFMSILIGVNDRSYGLTDDQTVENIGKMIDKVKELSPNTRLYIQAIYPVNPYVPNHAINDEFKYLDDLNARIQQITIDKEANFLDFRALLSNDKGLLKPAFTYDGLHPNALAYAHITAELVRHFEKYN